MGQRFPQERIYTIQSNDGSTREIYRTVYANSRVGCGEKLKDGEDVIDIRLSNSDINSNVFIDKKILNGHKLDYFKVQKIV